MRNHPCAYPPASNGYSNTATGAGVAETAKTPGAWLATRFIRAITMENFQLPPPDDDDRWVQLQQELEQRQWEEEEKSFWRDWQKFKGLPQPATAAF